MLIADKPERLELRAAVLEEQAERCIQQGQRLSARDFRQLAQRLRQEAAVLRRRRTDGMRFG